ncbi:diaminopimelate epimerase [Gorillibacterium massiliense]|uniref:diaminopimelate epimerase n=1 Tax=Gorillibacterium massiliense TaxID=1280390 RepID=UPI0004AEFFE2|nr:diaminopimelate epimerase [Gorillibacterium massiliense]
MEFTKMQGLGNDFIIVYGEERLPDNAGEMAVRLCDRHFGIGADGLVFILPSDKADGMMRIINSDGSEPEQCGNAIRCVAKYMYDNGIAAHDAMTIETIGAGVQNVQMTVEKGKATAVRVDMGSPILDAKEVPTVLTGGPIVAEPIAAGGREFQFTAVSMGNPHCVIFAEDADELDLADFGPKLEVSPLFPRKTNVEFVSVRSRQHLNMRVWERGAGPTLACGTGACATLVAAVLNGLTDRAATVTLPGGNLFIQWAEDGRVYMTGPAVEVFKGVIQN